MTIIVFICCVDEELTCDFSYLKSYLSEKFSDTDSHRDFLCFLFPALQIAEAAKTPSQADDLYLDDTGSGGYYPEDDDDFNSGSGSGESLSLSLFPSLSHTPNLTNLA